MNVTKEQIFLALLPSLYLRELENTSVKDKPGTEAANKAERAAKAARIAAEFMASTLASKA